MLGFRPTLIRSEDQLTGLLRARRNDLGWTQPELDDRIGFADGYSAKLEAPNRNYGRRAVWGIAASLGDWLQGLGLTLVVMDIKSAEALVQASTDPEPGTAAHTPYPERDRKRPLVRRTILRSTVTISRAA